MKSVLCIISLLVWLASSVAAATLHVAKTGNDANPGTAAQPFFTVQRALNAAQPGDTVVVGPGIYDEQVVTARAGTADQRIVIDGKGGAQVTKFSFSHPHHTLRAMTVAGLQGNFGDLVVLNRNAHFTRIENCALDAKNYIYIAGIKWAAPSTKPFGTDAASDCVVTGTTIRNIVGTCYITIFGDRNLIEKCQLLDGGSVDFFRMWGRKNIIRGNLCKNNYAAESTGNHPDFIQTFGDNGFGTDDCLIEQNVVRDIESGQLTQLSRKLLPDIGNWTFRNNVFANIALQASCTVPGIKYFNNTFYRCNYKNGGHALSFGERWFDRELAVSGSLVEGRRYRVNASGVDGGAITYNGAEYGHNDRFYATKATTFTKLVSTATVHWQDSDKAHNAEVKNNVFLDCGDIERVNTGWYSFSTELELISADFNYVGKANFGPVRVSKYAREIGHPDGWDAFSWYEPNGINGGDPGFVDVARLDFTLKPDSILIDRGTRLTAVVDDFLGAVRPQGKGYDIGAFEFGGNVSLNRPRPVRGVQVLLTD